MNTNTNLQNHPSYNPAKHGSNSVTIFSYSMASSFIYHSSRELCLIPCLSREPPLELRIIGVHLEQYLRWHDIHCANCALRFKWDLMRYPIFLPWCLECCENVEDVVDVEASLIHMNQLTSYYLEKGVRIWMIHTD